MMARESIRCPQCGKKFSSETNVLRHMNQPTGLCYAASLYQDHHSNVLHETFQGNDRPIPSNVATPESDPESDIRESIDHPPSPAVLPFDFGHESAQSGDIGMDLDDADASPQTFIETFPGCSNSYPGGATFMDFFWQDKYAQERQENLYYPFASKEEWQFSSWCLRSGLSMTALDGLLSLSMVSVQCIY